MAGVGLGRRPSCSMAGLVGIGEMRAMAVRLAVAVFGLALAGCGALAPLPDPTTLKDRLAALPTDGMPLDAPVTVRWDDHQVPYIEAASDADLAFALGLVHAHLRLGQMETMRRIAEGRTAEMAGPPAVDIDKGLRIMAFARLARKVEAGLPAATRAYLERYVAGINWYLFHVQKLPQEFAVLGLGREAWTVHDVLAIERLGATDVNWLIWFNLLKLRKSPEWPALWHKLVQYGTASIPSMDGKGGQHALETIFKGWGRPGSNSVVVDGRRTGTGAAMIASDPHLGINLPNVWLIAGMKSPGYNAVGLMFPGLPFVAVGRNPWIAWGGTNMRAAASDLYDVSKLPASDITSHDEKIKVRWWADAEVTVRETPYGPIVTDAPSLANVGGPYALRWVGQDASDEITAMLKVNRARNFDEYREAFRTFAVPAQNMMYADAEGHIGQVMAVRLPIRAPGTPPDLVRDPADPNAAWREMDDPTQLPYAYDPAKGWLSSANNKPVETLYPIGYFFSPDDRIERMAMLLGGDRRIGVAELEALQQDVYMISAVRLRDGLVAAMDRLGVRGRTPDETAFLDRLRAWDGYYRVDSRGAVAFEDMFHFFRQAFYAGALDPEAARNFISVADIKKIMTDDVHAALVADPPRLAAALTEALGKATGAAAEFPIWGDMHRLRLSHLLANIPLIGGRYRFGDFPAAGSTDTLMKTSAGSSAGRHAVGYGSQARHVSDLADPDRNFFLLLGGEDGWFNSSTFLDQVTMWREGRYIQVPLRPDTADRMFSWTTVLAPAGKVTRRPSGGT